MHDMLNVNVDGRLIKVADGTTVVAAIASASDAGVAVTRRSVRGRWRGPLCGMGICQECRVRIDGVAHRLACQTPCNEGMCIETGIAEAAI